MRPDDDGPSHAMRDMYVELPNAWAREKKKQVIYFA